MVNPCFACGGRKTCVVCAGMGGRLLYSGMWFTCPLCGGTGKYVCPSCNGQGTVTTIVWSDGNTTSGIMSNGTVLQSTPTGEVIANGPNGVTVYPADGSSTSSSSSSSSSSNSSSSSSSNDYIEEIVYTPDYTGNATKVWCEQCKTYRYPHKHVLKKVK